MSTCACGSNHPDGARYYVSCVSAGRTALLAGPLADHQTALGLVDRARDFAEKRDLWAHFYSFGTVALVGYSEPGVFNRELCIEVTS